MLAIKAPNISDKPEINVYMNVLILDLVEWYIGTAIDIP